MDKFWIVVTTIFALGLALIIIPQNQAELTHTDLETECRYANNPQHSVQVENRMLLLEGSFPIQNIEQEPRLSLDIEGNKITFKASVTEGKRPKTLYNNCLASAVYSAKTVQIPEGNYVLRIIHDNKEVEKKIVTIS